MEFQRKWKGDKMKAVIYMRVGNPDQLDDWPSDEALRRPPRDMGRNNADNDICSADVADGDPTV